MENYEENLRRDLEKLSAQLRSTGSLAGSEEVIEAAHSAAKKMKWGEGIALSLYLNARIYEAKREMKKAEKLNSEALTLAKSLGLESLQLDCLASEANLYLWNNKLKEAYNAAQSTLASAEKNGNNYAAVLSHYVLGAVSQRYASDDQALNYFQMGLEQSQKFGYLKIQGRILHKLSKLFLTKHFLIEANKYAGIDAEIQHKLNSKSGIIRTQTKLVTILIEENKLADAKQIIDKIYGSSLESFEKGALLLCKGKIAFKKNDFIGAEKLFHEAIKNYVDAGRTRLLANAYSIISEMYLKRKNSKMSLYYSMLALKHSEGNKDNYLQSETYHLMYEASKLSKNATKALQYLELYNQKFLKEENQLLESRIQFIELQAENKMKQAELTSERQKSERLHLELEFKELELTEKTRHLIKQTDVMAQFRDDLRAIIRRSPKNDPLIQEIKGRLQEVHEKEMNWDEFKKEFDTAHPVFGKHLEEKHPQLSGMEKKVCAMLRLGLVTTDIAKLLKLSERNIENHRYRIRKKISLNTEKSLHEYLSKI